MGLKSWPTSKTPKSGPDELAQVMNGFIRNLCRPEQTRNTRELLRFPEDAQNFHTELFYLHVFSVVASVGAAFRDQPEFCEAAIQSFFALMVDAMEAGETFTHCGNREALGDRVQSYDVGREKGLEEQVKIWPVLFVDVHGTWRSPSRGYKDSIAFWNDRIKEGLATVMIIEVWLTALLKETIAGIQQWREEHCRDQQG